MEDKRKPDTQLAKAIRDLQNEIDSKAFILKALREQYDASEIDYYEYLKTEAWQEQRAKIFKRDGFRCVCCEAEKNLEVHHVTYKNLGAEEVSDLVTLCRVCHEKLHAGEILIPENRKPYFAERTNAELLLYALAMGRDNYKNIKYKIFDNELPCGLDLKIGSLYDSDDLDDNYGKYRWFWVNCDEVASLASLAQAIQNAPTFSNGKAWSDDKLITALYYAVLYKVREENYHITADYLLDIKFPKASPEEQEEIRKELAALEDELKEIRTLIGEL